MAAIWSMFKTYICKRKSIFTYNTPQLVSTEMYYNMQCSMQNIEHCVHEHICVRDLLQVIIQDRNTVSQPSSVAITITYSYMCSFSKFHLILNQEFTVNLILFNCFHKYYSDSIINVFFLSDKNTSVLIRINNIYTTILTNSKVMNL